MKLLGHNSKSDFTQKWGSVKVSFKTLYVLCSVADNSLREKGNDGDGQEQEEVNQYNEDLDDELDYQHSVTSRATTTKPSKRQRARDKLKNFKKKKVEVEDTIVAGEEPSATTVATSTTTGPALIDSAESRSVAEQAVETSEPTSVSNQSYTSVPLVRIETFSNLLSEFFRSVASWYHLATPIILQYLRHQLLNVMQMHCNIAKETMYQYYINIAKTLSSTANRHMQRLFINLIATGRGYPLFAAIVYTLRKIDSTDSLIAGFDLSTSFESLLDYSKLAASAMRPASKIQMVARAIDELMKIRNSLKVDIELKLQMLVAIENLLPDNRRDLRVRMYQQLIIPFIPKHGVHRGDRPNIEDMIIDSALTIIGPANHNSLQTLGLQLIAREIRATVTPEQLALAKSDITAMINSKNVEVIDLTQSDSHCLGLKEVLGE
jgi:hypothetical protein